MVKLKAVIDSTVVHHQKDRSPIASKACECIPEPSAKRLRARVRLNMWALVCILLMLMLAMLLIERYIRSVEHPSLRTALPASVPDKV